MALFWGPNYGVLPNDQSISRAHSIQEAHVVFYTSGEFRAPSLLVDQNDVAHIAFADQSGSPPRSMIYYGNNRNGTWNVSAVEVTRTLSSIHSLQLALHPDDPSVVYIAYVEASSGQLKLARMKENFQPWRTDTLNLRPGVDTLGKIYVGD